jgi:hypothetical protein
MNLAAQIRSLDASAPLQDAAQPAGHTLAYRPVCCTGCTHQ